MKYELTMFTSLLAGNSVFTAVCLFVCLFVHLLAGHWVDFHEIWATVSLDYRSEEMTDS